MKRKKRNQAQSRRFPTLGLQSHSMLPSRNNKWASCQKIGCNCGILYKLWDQNTRHQLIQWEHLVWQIKMQKKMSTTFKL